MKPSGLSIEAETIAIAEKRATKQMVRGVEKATEKFETARRIVVLAQSKREETLVESEGVMYCAGMF